MGSCVICGVSVEGAVCGSHEEDVVFEFRGSRPDQLVADRYYRGDVDGFADFGVFVNIGDNVTGLLHESELEERLDSLDWETGDAVCVQVQHVHDNGNVDLGWSIRQAGRDFRGELIHDPDVDGGTVRPEEGHTDDGGDANRRSAQSRQLSEGGGDRTDTPSGTGASGGETSEPGGRDSAAEPDSAGEDPPGESEDDDSKRETDADTTEESEDGESERATEADAAPEAEGDEQERVPTADLGDSVGETVRLEGRIADVRQTGGPTIFVVSDESGSVDCAAFEEAGVRAYPDLEVDDAVAVVGEVERRRGELQVESESVERLDDEAAAAVAERIEAALTERAAPPETALLAPDPAVEAVDDAVVAAATAIRRAVVESRPVIVRHTATVDGYVAGTAVERAVLPLVREHHAAADAEYHYIDRRPLDEPFYDIGAATSDVTDMLEDADRHGETHPLVVLVDAGTNGESAAGLDLLAAYDAPRVVVDGADPDEEIEERVAALAATPAVTSAVLAANVAAHVNPGVRDEVGHLPAVSYWENTPDAYVDLAATAGYDAEVIEDIRAAIALEAYYQSYEDKRELIRDLLWGEGELAGHVASQFREKLESELRTVTDHVERRSLDGGASLTLLDAAAFAHRFDFPPTTLLLDELHRRERDREQLPHVTVVVDEAELQLQSTDPLDARAVGEQVADDLSDAGVRPRGAADGRIEFLKGERVDVIESVIEAIDARLEVGQAAHE